MNHIKTVKNTPMMEQYLKIKENHPDTLLFFRLGDFYELFFEDAQIASRELEIVLTARDGGSQKIPMCGVPHHSANNYLAKLINRGYKVAICEQMQDPKAVKGLVDREVVKIITPGTVLDDIMLSESSNNYLLSIIETDSGHGLAYTDISTGDFWAAEIEGSNGMEALITEINRIMPAECLLPRGGILASLWQDNPQLESITHLTFIDDIPDLATAGAILCRQFDVVSWQGLGLAEYPSLLIAAAVIIEFLNTTQRTKLRHLRPITVYGARQFTDLDHITRKNLELTSCLRDGKKEGSLLGVLDVCNTAMGHRTMKRWIELPLKDIAAINLRLDAVEELKDNNSLRMDLKDLLSRVFDLERLAGKLGGGTANPRDLLGLKATAGVLGELKTCLQGCSSELLKTWAQMDPLTEAETLIADGIHEDAPLTIKEGNIIKDGYLTAIDELRDLSRKGSDWLLEFEQREKQRTGIKYLKVGFNRVFGYYIEISQSNLHMVPANYVRRQTLANTERFICEELKNYEDKILGARDRLINMEYHEYLKIREQLTQYLEPIQKTAQTLAQLDVVAALAQVAYQEDYARPELDYGGAVEIKNGRHPVVEKTLKDSRFIPNDVHLDVEGSSFALITGPNMGGKSTYMRQTALLTLMAQIGSFLPADKARIGIVDKIFTRVGASDDLSSGYSTFMMEMLEVANIVNSATEKSLIILDEIGRGTSTYDGISLAQAVSEYIVTNIKAKTLFATHYHELTHLSNNYPQITNLCVSVKENEQSVVFLKKILPGKADKSYGIHVARLAGVRPEIIRRAQIILDQIEQKQEPANQVKEAEQLSLFSNPHPVLEELERLNLDEITPKQALVILYQLKELV